MRPVLLILAALLPAVSGTQAPAREESGVASFLQALGVPTGLTPAAGAKRVTVAIVDDGMRLTHRELAPFLGRTPGGGAPGRDVADDDDEVDPPAGLEAKFYHGTHLAGIITQVFRRAYGEDAPKWLRLLPVKGVEDRDDRAYVKFGYKGIQYAAEAGADVILTAWGETDRTAGKLRILQAARDRGAMIIAAAGNYPEEREQFPAAYPPVLAISAVEADGRKTPKARYGGFVDLLAPGMEVVSASASSDDGREAHAGTSMSAAMVAAAVAVMKVQRPDLSAEEITACLKNTAGPVERFQPGEIYFGGKLGAGRINLAAALAYPLRQTPDTSGELRRQHQGYLASYRQPAAPVRWELHPEGAVTGFWFERRWISDPSARGRFRFFAGDSTEGHPVLEIDLRNWPSRQFVPGAHLTVMFQPEGSAADFQYLVEYASQPIQQGTLYCQGQVEVTKAGLIEDGSGMEPYSPQTSCKWLITAPPGKVARIHFLEFDTEPNMDWLYFFNGTGTHERIMAAYSGPRIPPDVTAWGPQVLMWFVTNERIQGKGWKAEVTFVDPTPTPPSASAK